MSVSVEKSSPSSTISSNYESPLNTKANKIINDHNSTPVSNAIPAPVIFVQILLHILSENKKSNDYYKKLNSNQDGHFTFKVYPSISLFDYLQRIIKYVRIELSTLIIAMIYIDRICREKVFLNEFNIHRIMLISIYMAYIYNEDCVFDNKYLALVSGLSKAEMMTLQEDFLDLVEFNLYVSDDEFEQYKKYFF